MKITVDGVVYDVVKEKEINGKCTGCFLKGNGYVNCLEITNIDCMVEKVIFLKTPVKFIEKIEQLEKQIELMKKCNNCKCFEEYNGLNIIENFSGLLGKQYLFLQDDGTYYNRYTDEYMTEEEAIDWLYSELSEVINK